MAKGFRHGPSGGGEALTFRVVGSLTEPEAPRENDIWVETESAVNGWIFSAAEPESPAEGMVWFTIGTTSTAAFNALEKNGIMIYPVSALQYLSGVWEKKTPKSWQAGAWADWWIEGTLYADGRTDQAITGGWKTYSYAVGTGYTGQSAQITDEADGLVISMTNGGSNRSSFFSTANAIDLTEYSSVVYSFESAYSSTGGGIVQPRVYSASGTYIMSGENVLNGNEFRSGGSIDVSGLSGEYRVGFIFFCMSSGAVTEAKMTMMRLVKPEQAQLLEEDEA